MSGGSSPSSQTVTNRTEIDPVTQQWRQELFSASKGLYDQGAPAYYPGSTVVPFSNQTQSGLDMLQQQAIGGAPNLDAANLANARALSGWNPALPYAMNAASGGLQSNPYQAATAMSGMASNPWGGLIAGAGAQPTTLGMGALQNIANGGGQNPALDSLFASGARQVTDAVNANFARAGRSGANAAHTGALTQGLGDLWSQVYTPAFEAQQARSLQAASLLPQIQQADRAAQMSGYSTAGGLYGDDVSRRMQGLTAAGAMADSGANRTLQGIDSAGSIYSQANQDAARSMALLPSVYQYGSAPGQQLVNIGGAYEGLAGDYLADDQARYNYNVNAPWQYLQQYANIVNGLPDFSSQTSTQTGVQSRNRGMGALGGAMAGAQLGSMFGPLGTGLGAIGGGLFGLF